jgi:hypothetical protein
MRPPQKWAVAEPRTAREALIAEVLGEVDGLVTRVEALQKALDAADARLARTVATLNLSTDKYRHAVSTFADQAKTDVNRHLQHLADDAAAKTLEDQRAAMLTAARFAFRAEVSGKATALAEVLNQSAREFRRTRRTRMIESGIAAFAASIVSALVVWMLLH